MSETIGEMILPGTYIEVRSEGLIGVGGIAVGNVGVVGTANRGPLDKVVILGSYSEAVDTFGSYDAWFVDTDLTTPPPLTLTRTLEQLVKGGASTVYAVRVSSDQTVAATFKVQDSAGVDIATLTANSPGSWGNDITVTPEPTVDPTTIVVEYRKNKEEYPVTTAKDLVDAITQSSGLLTASVVAGKEADVPDKVVDGVVGGPDGAAAGPTELADGLALLGPENVNIVVAGGLDATDAGVMITHVNNTETDGHERIAVIGASKDDVAVIGAEAPSNARIVLVAPGIEADDAAAKKKVKLPASYAAALVAGRLASLATHVSLTNKDLPVNSLTTNYTRAQQKQLLGKQVLVLHKNLGIRVLKGITTDTGAFRQISVRRIVDEAKAGVRIGSNPYIGRLNNARVRAALKATLDGFLSGMVLDEKLVGYTLDVSATRQQEINGIALVAMTLLPTFSIDFVKVIMTLQ